MMDDRREDRLLAELQEIAASLRSIAAYLEPRSRQHFGTRSRQRILEALTALGARGELRDGLSNNQVHTLVLRELGVSQSDPPYGLKSTESIRLARLQFAGSLTPRGEQGASLSKALCAQALSSGALPASTPMIPR